MTDLVLGGGQLTLADIAKTLAGAVKVTVDAGALGKVRAGHAAVLDLLTRGDPLYGVNTGFGKLANTRIGNGDLALLQQNLVRSHAAGVGELVPGAVVRLMMVLKAQSLCAGHSGVSPGTLGMLNDLINRDVLPAVPRQGSVGASGDLAPLAHMALVMIGEGEVLTANGTEPAEAALSAQGLAPVTLGPKEGLALLNGTQASTALALAALVAMERNIKAAVVAGAMSTDAVMGSDTPFDARIHALRPHSGQVRLAALYRALMAGSEIRASHRHDDDKVQDPYSFRCQPQVMGACLDLAGTASASLLIEANAVSDNPLVFPDGGEVLSGGNFHAQPVAFAADMLALAIAETGALSERRIAELTDTTISSLPPFLTHMPGLNSGYMMAHVTAAALASENKQLAAPASVDSLPTSANQEDHVSMATHAAWRLRQMNANTGNIIAIELLAAAEGIDFRRPLKSSAPLEDVHALIRARVPERRKDRVFSTDIETISTLIATGAFDRFAGELMC